MKKEIPWLASLCVQQHLIDSKVAHEIIATLPPDADAMAFAQAVIDHAHITDIELMTRLATEARHLAASGIDAPPIVAHAPAKGSDEVDFSRVKSLNDLELQEFMLELLGAAQAFGASDLHLSAGAAPYIRKMRALEFLDATPLSAEDAFKLNTCLLSPEQKEIFLKRRDFDYALAMEGGRRIRVNLMEHKQGFKGSYRIVPEHVLTPAELGFKNIPVLKKLLSYHNGLILVTGPVGAGKTTTLNSLIEELNRTRDDHIVTVEEPIEFVHRNKKSVIVHREVGEHTTTFADALRGAMRADPDIILVGEMRQIETMRLALGCASMGMLVFSTLHTNNAPKTIDRIIDAFPADEQNQIRVMLDSCLRGVVSQLLCKKITGGRVAVHEILLPHDALGGTIRSGNIASIRNIIEGSRGEGMVSMDASLRERYDAGDISAREAYMKATDKTLFEKLLGPELASVK